MRLTQRRQLVLAVVVLAGCVSVAWWWSRDAMEADLLTAAPLVEPTAAPLRPPAGASTALVPGVHAALPSELPQTAVAPGAPRRIELPPPAVVPPTPRRLFPPPADRPRLTDRRGRNDPRAAEQLEALSYGLETLEEDLQECLQAWTDLDPARSTEVVLGFDLSPTGLTRSFVEGADDVPFGPRTCLASAVHGIDWSHITDSPAMVTYRFTLHAPDAGP